MGGAHIGVFFGVLLVGGGLATLYCSITEEPGAALARLGFAAVLMGAGVMAI